jgi:hypothetical protein
VTEFISIHAFAGLEIPHGLNSADRKKATEILGLSSATKVLGNPYPLGGFSGVEIGYSKEIIPTSEIGRLGSRAESKSETSYQVLTLGKGLYNNIDVFVQMTPQTQDESIWGFGGQLRWGFYQAQYMPIHLSLMTYANSMTFNNQIQTLTEGSDLVAGFSVEDVTLFTGVGFVSSTGTFIGGASGVSASGDTTQEQVSDAHYVAGVNLRLQSAFLAMEIDRYTQAIYSAKIGMRF